MIAMWVHLFPSRTQKLSTSAPTILGGRLPGKIGNANTRESGMFLALFFYMGTSGPSTCFLLGCPVNVLGDGAPSSLTDPGHSLRSLYPPQAALPSLPIPNTEVKHICPCCGARHLRRRRSGFLICRPMPLAPLLLSAAGSSRVAPRQYLAGDCLGR